ncbi:MAG: hypothetical protein H0X66_19160 [Verrucomicrobia bacterium]|nr:hypothetical protein [Verrucomicrobiota bacterium]
MNTIYLKEKALEEEYPGIGFRDFVGGREAYVLGHRVAVWEVVDVYHEAKTIAKTADHFGWTPALVRCALAFAKAFPDDIAKQRHAEVGA